jgi:quercetin dioxygenase-like cupin family protein
MDDKHGLKAAADRGIALGEIGNTLLFENEYIRLWEVRLEPGQTIDFHIHYHPYLVVSLGGGDNEIETIFGRKISTNEPAGSFVFINEMREVHRLTNKANVTYLSRLIELKSVTWSNVGSAQ